MKLRYVDAIRGIAILAVLVVHCGQVGKPADLPPFMQSLITNGIHGVQLFYVASAFTLFLSLSHRYSAERHPWLNFFARRFFRIAPMYYLGVIYFLWQDGFGPRYWLGDADSVSVSNVLANIFFVHGFNPYWMNSVVPGGWSIAVEMLFYCLLPFLFLKIKNCHHACLFVMITLLLRAILQFVFNRIPMIDHETLWQNYLYLYLPSQLPVFALGILLYFIIRENYKLTLSPLLVFVSFFVVMMHLVGIPLLPNHFLFSIGFLILAVALSRYEFKLVVNPVIVHIGKVSFSMYLFHFAILFWMEKMGWVNFISVNGDVGAIINFGIRLLVLSVASVAIASLFYSAVEVPMQKLGKRLMRTRASLSNLSTISN